MTDSELLVQRFLDQELSAEERVRFLTRLGREEALRQRLIELEELVLDVSRLPRPTVPEGFADRILERVGEQVSERVGERISERIGEQTATPQPMWRRVADAFWKTHTLRWNLAGAAAAASLAVLLVGGLLVRGVLRPSNSSTNAGYTETQSTQSSPAPVLVRFVVLQPDASAVHVVGDFNQWNPGQTPLEPLSDGAWTVTIPLTPGRYQYMFVVDGREWIADPFAAEQRDDGFGSRNAVIDVRPPTGTSL